MAEVAGGGVRRLWAEVRKYYVLKKMESMYAKEFLTKFPLTGKHNLSTYQTGWLAVMYLGYLASGGSNLEPAYIAGGLDTIMSQVHLGKSLDQAIAANSQGKFSGLKDFEAKFTADNQEVVDFTITLLNTVGQGRGSLLFDSYADDDDLVPDEPYNTPLFWLYVRRDTKTNTYNNEISAKSLLKGGSATIAGVPGPGGR